MEESLTLLGYLLILLITLTIQYLLGIGTHCLRPTKISSFWLGFFFSVIGFLIVSILKISDHVEYGVTEDKIALRKEREIVAKHVHGHVVFYSSIIGAVWLLVFIALGITAFQKHLNCQRAKEQQRIVQEKRDQAEREAEKFELQEREKLIQQRLADDQRRKDEMIQQQREREEHQRQLELERVAYQKQLEIEEAARIRKQAELEILRLQQEKERILQKEQEISAEHERITAQDNEIIKTITDSFNTLKEKVNNFGEPTSRHVEELDEINIELNEIRGMSLNLSSEGLLVFNSSELSHALSTIITEASRLHGIALNKMRRIEAFVKQNIEQQHQNEEASKQRREEYRRKRAQEKANHSPTPTPKTIHLGQRKQVN